MLPLSVLRYRFCHLKRDVGIIGLKRDVGFISLEQDISFVLSDTFLSSPSRQIKYHRRVCLYSLSQSKYDFVVGKGVYGSRLLALELRRRALVLSFWSAVVRILLFLRRFLFRTRNQVRWFSREVWSVFLWNVVYEQISLKTLIGWVRSCVRFRVKNSRSSPNTGSYQGDRWNMKSYLFSGSRPSLSGVDDFCFSLARKTTMATSCWLRKKNLKCISLGHCTIICQTRHVAKKIATEKECFFFIFGLCGGAVV